MQSIDRTGGAIEVTVVSAPACHLCDDARTALAELATVYPLRVRTVELSSEEGRAVLLRTGAPMPPIVLVDGELLGWGRLSRGKLRRRLEQLATGDR